MFSPLLYFSFWLGEDRKDERSEGMEERGGHGEEMGKGEEDKEERKGWKTERHISWILNSSFLSSSIPSSRPPLSVTSALSSLSLGRRRLIFGSPPTRWPPALLGMGNDWRYVFALRLMKRLTPIKTPVKRRIRLLPHFNIVSKCGVYRYVSFGR